MIAYICFIINQKHFLTHMENIKYKGYEIKPQGRVDFKLREAYEVNGQIIYGMKAVKKYIDEKTNPPKLMMNTQKFPETIIPDLEKKVGEQKKIIEELKEATEKLLAWANIKDGSPSEYLRNEVNNILSKIK